MQKSPKIWCRTERSNIGVKNWNEIWCKICPEFWCTREKSNVGVKNWNEIGCKICPEFWCTREKSNVVVKKYENLKLAPLDSPRPWLLRTFHGLGHLPSTISERSQPQLSFEVSNSFGTIHGGGDIPI